MPIQSASEFVTLEGSVHADSCEILARLHIIQPTCLIAPRLVEGHSSSTDLSNRQPVHRMYTGEQTRHSSKEKQSSLLLARCAL